MNVLIVEDDKIKLEHVESFIRSKYSYIATECARSYNSGLRKALFSNFDLIILDMSLPRFDVTPDDDGGRPQAYAGRDMLQQIKRKEKACKVVVVTQFETFGEGQNLMSLKQLVKYMECNFSKNYIGCIYFSTQSDEWKSKLTSIIDNIQGERND